MLINVFKKIFPNLSDKPLQEVKENNGDPLKGYTSEQIRKAALDIFWPDRNELQCDKSWIGGTVEKCEQALKNVHGVRQKYKNYPHPKIKKAIMSWIDFYESQAEQNLIDCQTQASLKNLNLYKDKNSKETQITNDILRKLGHIK